MSRIYINENAKDILKNVKITKLNENKTEEYKTICKEADIRIREAHIKEGEAYIKSKNFIAFK